VLYGGKGYELWRWNVLAGSWEFVADFDPGWTRRMSGAVRLTSRLRRDGFYALSILPSGDMVAILPGAIARCPAGAQRFQPTWQIRRGTRPLSMVAVPDGSLYWGEYYRNSARSEVHVYGSRDGGCSWDVVYTFGPGQIRHVHSITHDPHRACLWMCTGDYGRECRILKVALDWSTVETVLEGTQQARTVRPVPTPDGLYFATDSELEQNHVYWLGDEGSIEPRCATSGPCLSACQVGTAMFFSTDVEPSKVNREPRACLYGSRDGRTWTRLLAWRKDRWPMTLFQFGNIALPTGRNDTAYLAATGVAVEKEDGVTSVWTLTSGTG